SVTAPGIPESYGDPKTSGIMLTVGKGSNITFFAAKSPTIPEPKDEGRVTGKVTLDGKPLAKGKVNLIDKDGKLFSAAIAADGRCAGATVPAGGYKVTITDAGAPAKFADTKTSGIEMVVKKGANDADFDLKGK